MGNRIEIKNGERFGRWTVVNEIPLQTSRLVKRMMFVRCDCGSERELPLADLRRGNTKSCGCLQKEIAKKQMTTHGMKNTKEWESWHSMIQRCFNPKHKSYHYYGERGITVCDRWRKAENFMKDMGPRPDGMSLDRIDNNGNYCPENCKWSTPTE